MIYQAPGRSLGIFFHSQHFLYQFAAVALPQQSSRPPPSEK